MEITMTIDDELFEELRERAEAEKTTWTELADRALRQCVQKPSSCSNPPIPRDMGAPLIDLTKVWEFIADEEAEEFQRLSKTRP